MHHKNPHHSHGHDRDRHDRDRHDRDRRFARGDRDHGARGNHGHGGRGGWAAPTDRELRRFFAHGDLRLVILRLIAEKPRHGYEIIKEIEERVAGAYSPSPGVIYPTLTLLEELGYVAVTQGEGGRKSHEITDAGRAFLTANGPAVEALFVRMAQANRARGTEPAPRIVRAMQNLDRVLRMRLDRGPLTVDQVTAVTTALDTAAVAVERT
jgi:DNA-binding PadR family transcriptional regulator